MPNEPEETEPKPPLKANTLAGRCHAEQWGDLGELAFVLKAASLGIVPSKPYGDRHPYDFLVQHGQRLSRVQVKTVFRFRVGQNPDAFPVVISKNGRKGRKAYTSDEVDFVAVLVVPHDAWYLIPVESLCGRKFINLYPGGTRRKDGGQFESFREAWHLLKAE